MKKLLLLFVSILVGIGMNVASAGYVMLWGDFNSWNNSANKIEFSDGNKSVTFSNLKLGSGSNGYFKLKITWDGNNWFDFSTSSSDGAKVTAYDAEPSNWDGPMTQGNGGCMVINNKDANANYSLTITPNSKMFWIKKETSGSTTEKPKYLWAQGRVSVNADGTANSAWLTGANKGTKLTLENGIWSGTIKPNNSGYLKFWYGDEDGNGKTYGPASDVKEPAYSGTHNEIPAEGSASWLLADGTYTLHVNADLTYWYVDEAKPGTEQPTADFTKKNNWGLIGEQFGGWNESNTTALTGENGTYTITTNFEAGKQFKLFNANGTGEKYWGLSNTGNGPDIEPTDGDHTAYNTAYAGNMKFSTAKSNVTITITTDVDGNITNLNFSGINGGVTPPPANTNKVWAQGRVTGDASAWDNGEGKGVELIYADGFFSGTIKPTTNGSDTEAYMHLWVKTADKSQAYGAGSKNVPVQYGKKHNNTTANDSQNWAFVPGTYTIHVAEDFSYWYVDEKDPNAVELTMPDVLYIEGNWFSNWKKDDDSLKMTKDAEAKTFTFTCNNYSANNDMLFRFHTGKSTGFNDALGDVYYPNEGLKELSNNVAVEIPNIGKVSSDPNKCWKYNSNSSAALLFTVDFSGSKPTVKVTQEVGPEKSKWILAGDCNDWFSDKMNSRYKDSNYTNEVKDTWRFESSANAAYPASEGWLQVDVKKCNKDGKLWGQFKIFDGRWNSYDEGIYGHEYGSPIDKTSSSFMTQYFGDNNKIKNDGNTYSVHFNGDSNSNYERNLVLGHNAYTDCVVYFNPDKCKIALEGDAQTYYIYYATKNPNAPVKAKLNCAAGNTNNYCFDFDNFANGKTQKQQVTDQSVCNDRMSALDMKDYETLNMAYDNGNGVGVDATLYSTFFTKYEALKANDEGNDGRTIYVAQIPVGFECPAGSPWFVTFTENGVEMKGTYVLSVDNIFVVDGVNIYATTAKMEEKDNYNFTFRYRLYGVDTDHKVKAYNKDFSFAERDNEEETEDNTDNSGYWYEMSEYSNVNPMVGDYTSAANYHIAWDPEAAEDATNHEAKVQIPATYGTQYIQFEVKATPKAQSKHARVLTVTSGRVPDMMTINQYDDEIKLPGQNYVFADGSIATAIEKILEDIDFDGDFEDGEEVAPVYYNLQGVRVENPTSGLYIVVRGNKSSKVIF